MYEEARITALYSYPYRLPFAHSFTTAHGPMQVREGAIIELATTQGIAGVGEIAPLPDFGGGKLSDALCQLPDVTVHLQGKTLRDALMVVTSAQVPMQPAVACGLEIALLDALGKYEGRPVCALLARSGVVPRAGISVNAVVGAQTLHDVVEEGREAQRMGFGCLKLKVGCMASVKDEIERIAATRAAVGPQMHLRLDANERWTLEEARAFLEGCLPYNIQYIEQPLKRNDLHAMRQLRQSVSIPIAADEAVHDVTSAYEVMACEAADILVLKPQLVGGLHAAQRIISEAAERGIQCVITTTIESGVSLMAALHLAAASPLITLECGLATHQLLIDDLVVEELSVQRGVLPVPMGAGLGVTLDREALQRYWKEL
jgi:o-succinylbenzoate synthase